MGTMLRRTLIATLLLPAATAAQAEDVRAIQFSDTPQITLNDRMRVFLRGRLSPIYLYGRSSVEEGHYGATSQRAPSGLAGRIAYSANDGTTLAAVAQLGATLNASDETRFFENEGGVDGEVLRADLIVEDVVFGDFTIGFGPTVSNDLATQDLSGTQIVTGADMRLMGGDFIFDESVSGQAGATGRRVRLSDAYYRVEGLGRRVRLRYDSPDWNGLRASFSADRFGLFDFGLRYRRDFENGWRLAAALGGASGVKTPRRNDSAQYSFSVSGVAPWGTGATFAFSSPEPGEFLSSSSSAEFFYYGKVSQTFDLLPFGPTAVSMDYGFTQWYRAVGEDVEKYGIAVTQAFWDDRLAAYASLHTADLDEAGESEVDETQTFVTGLSLQF